MPDLLADFQPWDAAEIKYNAREAFLEFFWDDLEEFNLTMRCQGAEDLVNPKLMAALKVVDKDPWAAALFLRDAKKSLEEFASSCIPDSFVKEAVNQYLTDQEIEAKWG